MGSPSTAALRVTVSPNFTRTAPWACFASLPVSILSLLPPISRSTRLACTELPCHVRAGEGREGELRIEDRRGPFVAILHPQSSLPQAELADDVQVPAPVLVAQVGQQAGPLAHHHQEAAPAGVVLLVG